MSSPASIRVQVPGYGIVQFPAGTSEEEMRAALTQLPAKPPTDYNALAEQARQSAPSSGWVSADQIKPIPVQGPSGMDVFKPDAHAQLRAQIEAKAAAGDPKAQQVLDGMREFERGQRQDADLLPIAGAAAAAAMTGGGAVPAILAAGGGAAGGQALKDTQWNMSPADRAVNAAKSAAGAMLTQGAGEAINAGLQWAGPRLTSVARSLWLKMAKVPDSVAKQSVVAKTDGLPAAKTAIAETVLSQKRGTISPANLEAMKDNLTALDQALNTAIAGSGKTIPRQDLINALVDHKKFIGTGSIGQDMEQQAIDKAIKLMRQQPPAIRVQDAQKIKQRIYDQWNYAAEAKEPAAAMADKVTGRALRGSIAAAEPAVAPINAELSRNIPATAAMEKAVGKAQNVNPVQAAQQIALAITNPKTLAGALITVPGIGSFSAQVIYNIGKALPTHAKNPANVMRLLGGLVKSGQE